MTIKKTMINLFVIGIVVGTVIFKLFFYDYMIISGNSMSSTYKNGDVVLLEKKYQDIKRYDVVIVKINNEEIKEKIIKRVVGLPMETIQIIDGYVYINGIRAKDDVTNIKIEDAGIANIEVNLAADEYFLLGDNRNESEDSRSKRIGVIKKDQIIGRVFGGL